MWGPNYRLVNLHSAIHHPFFILSLNLGSI